MGVPTTTRAAVLTAHGEPLEITELPLPASVEPGAALVRITNATLCGTDVELWSGKMTFPGMLPMVLGHEMTGEVIATGPGTTDALGREVRPGSRIGWSESTCGQCHGCRVLREPVTCAERGYGFRQRADRPPYATAGLCEYAYVVPKAAKLLLPQGFPDSWAAMAGCTAKTVLRAFSRAGGVPPGARVAVLGSGALGLFATAVARIVGAGHILVVDTTSHRLELAREFGADATVLADSEEVPARVRELTSDAGADLVFDFAGAPAIGAQAVEMAAIRGRVVIVGSTGPDPSALPLGTVMGKELALFGSLNGDIADYHAAIEFFEAFADRMPWHKLLGTPVGLTGATAHLDAMRRRAEIKAVIEPHLDRE
ncbi:zinc-binding dehydrogenase [Sciscionella marina]|uniref:zinc-binding dehydrogenase n=1 Tax=Sciscionella marina TaxID=508770 RepID=UPI000372EFB7|nr:zinc-binding dehydrogenase [Sciscionella marina]